jgi:hypothetical protein
MSGFKMTGFPVKMGVKRGPQTWAFIYVTLGFALSIEGTIIGFTSFDFTTKLISFAVLAGVTFWLFMDNAWFQNKLVTLKTHYEDKDR